MQNSALQQRDRPAALIVCILFFLFCGSFYGLSSETLSFDSQSFEEARANAVSLLKDYAITPPILTPATTNALERALIRTIIEGVVDRLTHYPCGVVWNSNNLSLDCLYAITTNNNFGNRLNAAMQPLFKDPHIFRAIETVEFHGSLLDPVWARDHQVDLTKGKQAWFAVIGAQDVHKPKIIPKQVWSTVIRAASDLYVDLDLSSLAETQTRFFVATHWKPINQSLNAATNSGSLIIYERLHIELVVDDDERRGLLSVETIITTRKRDSKRVQVFIGDSELLQLRRANTNLNMDECLSSISVGETILRTLTNSVAVKANHETK